MICSRNCPLYSRKKKEVFISGPADAEVICIGGAPSYEAEKRRSVFEGSGWVFFKELVSDIGIEFESFRKIHLIQCRTKEITDAAISNCAGNVDWEIKKLKPKYLVSFGEEAANYICGVSDIGVRSGFAHYSARYKLPCFVLEHPSKIMRRGNKAEERYKKHLKSLAAFIFGDSQRFIKDQFVILRGADEVEKVFYTNNKEWATFDFETTGLDFMNDTPLGLGIRFGYDPYVYYVPLYVNDRVESIYPEISVADSGLSLFSDGEDKLRPVPDIEKIKEILRKFFLNPKIRKVAHNASFDVLIAWRLLGEIPVNATTDTYLMGYCIDSSGKYPLDFFVGHFPELSAYQVEVQRFKKETGSYSRIPSIVNGKYCCGDVYCTSEIVAPLMKRVRSSGVEELTNLYFDLTDIYSRSTIKGIRVDEQRLQELRDEYADERKAAVSEISSLYSIEAGSAKQLSNLLYIKMGLEPKKETATGYSVDEGALKLHLEDFAGKDELSDKEKEVKHLIELVLQYRNAVKIMSTYLDGLRVWIKDGRVHPETHLNVARSGRTAMRHPNIQNQPVRDARSRRIRGMFIPDEGKCFIESDMVRAEIMIAAWYSQDETFIRLASQGDIYRNFGAIVYNTTPEELPQKIRNLIMKPAILAIQYLSGAKTLMVSINMSADDDKYRVTLSEAKKIIDTVSNTIPGFIRWRDRTINKIERTGIVKNCFGRVRRGEKPGDLFNTLIQGTCSDFLQFAIRDYYRGYVRDHNDVDFLFNIHDACYSQAPLDLADETHEAFKAALTGFASKRGLDFLDVEKTIYPERWGEKL